MNRVLISGAGVAGPTLAYWLRRYGFTPTIVERAPQLRTGGYVIDFWGVGYRVASRMGVVNRVEDRGYHVRELRIVNRRGESVVRVPTDGFIRVAGTGFITVPRSELAATIYQTIEDDVETIFGDTITSVVEHPHAVEVTFERYEPRVFDLVIGADGLHSRMRALVFGPENQFEQYLGIKVAAFATRGYQPRDELTYVMYTEVGQEVSRFSMNDDRTMFLFTFADDDPHLPASCAEQKAVLRERFGRSGWECPRILEALDSSSELYFDRVSQIDMGGQWSRGRVALIGDAAFCISLLGGQGTALAMAAGYILAGELYRAAGDHVEAFRRYQQRFAPFILKKQRAARRFAGAFAPRSRTVLFLRNLLFKLSAIPAIAAVTTGRGFRDAIELPTY